MENCKQILPPWIAVFLLVLYIDFSKDFKRHGVFECVYLYVCMFLTVRSSVRPSVRPLIGRSVSLADCVCLSVCARVRVFSDPCRRQKTHGLLLWRVQSEAVYDILLQPSSWLKDCWKRRKHQGPGLRTSFTTQHSARRCLTPIIRRF